MLYTSTATPAASASPVARTLAPLQADNLPMLRLFARLLDELDHGVLLLDAFGGLLHRNHRARQCLGDEHPLIVEDGQLRARDPRDLQPLQDALAAAALRGLRRMLTVGEGAARTVVALVPIEPEVAALMLGKDQVGEALSIQCFASAHNLTPAEARVLSALGRGERPADIAAAQGVKLSTVRTQIGAIREKTGAESITALVRIVASLPPMVGALRR